MGSVHLVRRWGSHDAGSTVDVDDTMAAWLVGNHFAERPDAPGTASAGVLAPGGQGADLRAGGDLSRPGTPRWQRSSRVEGVTEDNPEGNHVNRAAKVAGAPRAFAEKAIPASGKQGDAAPVGSSVASPASGETAKAAAGEKKVVAEGEEKKNPRFSW